MEHSINVEMPDYPFGNQVRLPTPHYYKSKITERR